MDNVRRLEEFFVRHLSCPHPQVLMVTSEGGKNAPVLGVACLGYGGLVVVETSAEFIAALDEEVPTLAVIRLGALDGTTARVH